MGSFHTNVASAKLTFIEKYKYAYEEDLNIIRDALGAQITYSDDGKRATVTCMGNTVEIEVRD